MVAASHLIEPNVTDTSAGPLRIFAARYEIERELGQGGMATVYLAHDLVGGSRVALKQVRPELAPVIAGERFTREINILSHLHHPNILPVLDTGIADGLPFFVMPYVDGKSLTQLMHREGQLTIRQAVDITCEVADALVAAHAEGFVHRDIKPSNILLSEGRVFLADFGIARAIDVSTGEKLTDSGLAVGTVAYMSPEQAAGGRVDARSDGYSLGCVLYEMLVGGPPFTGATPQAVLSRHAVDSVPGIRTVRPTVSLSLERIVMKALAKVPADRYATAEQFKRALRQLDLSEPSPDSSRRRTLLRTLVGVTALGVLALGWRFALWRSHPLDPNRVMVYPLVAPDNFVGPRTIGEDVASMIGNALDGTGPLRWIDGWSLLKPEQREDIRTLSLKAARSLARAKRCAYYVTGRLVPRGGDSVEVFLDLYDVQGDSTIGRGKGGGSSSDAWQAGLNAVNDVLPKLIPGGPTDVLAGWKDREPGAIASFLLGEAAFRRVHLDSALAHYRTAVKADSLFGLAAIRGAQAATWNHRPEEAASLIQVAIRQKLPLRYQHFALGYNAYLNGQPDSASAEFRRALAMDPEMGVAWMLLGEVYTHLLPETGNPDSLAEAAFEEAHRLDPQASTLLLHLIEIRLRRGEVVEAEPLVRQFLAADPDTTLAFQVRFMDRCVRSGPDKVDWRQGAQTHPLALLAAGNMLKGGGSQIDCARRAFTAVLEDDTVAGEWGDARRWSALIGLQGILLAQGRASEVTGRIDSAIARGLGGSSLYLIDAPLAPELQNRAMDVARRDKIQFGEHFVRCPYPNRLWALGLWADHAGATESVAAIGQELERRAQKSGSAYERAGADAMRARVALAHGDTVGAIEQLMGVLSEAIPGDELPWDLTAARGSERLELAQLLMARGEFQRTLDVASVFDSAWPIGYMLYLPGSLRLRSEAAAKLGDAALAARYDHRLAALREGQAVAMK